MHEQIPQRTESPHEDDVQTLVQASAVNGLCHCFKVLPLSLLSQLLVPAPVCLYEEGILHDRLHVGQVAAKKLHSPFARVEGVVSRLMGKMLGRAFRCAGDVAA
jgi:hypothetical protein